MPDVHKAGLLAIRQGRVLLCRKRKGTRLLILPGGKLERGETAEEALVRELDEELAGLLVSGIRYVGSYRHVAAEGDRLVVVELFTADVNGEPRPQAEIAELVWFDPARDDWEQLAPSLREVILPDVLRHHWISPSNAP